MTGPAWAWISTRLQRHGIRTPVCPGTLAPNGVLTGRSSKTDRTTREEAVMLNRVAVALVIVCLVVTAQTTSTAILGTVVDSSGATVSGADIVITNTGTGQSRSLKTNEAGYFNAPALDPGSYSVSVTKEGF